MKNFLSLFFLTAAVLVLPGCTTTFAGTVLVLTFRDIVLYIAIAFIMSAVDAILSPANTKRTFWICFIASLLLTPLAGFIYFLILISKKID